MKFYLGQFAFMKPFATNSFHLLSFLPHKQKSLTDKQDLDLTKTSGGSTINEI
jgi:hypothetical protein